MDKSFKNSTKRIDNTIQYANMLRYLVTESEFVHSTAVKDPLGCQYIYVKPGMRDNIAGISNIDFVQAIYAENGIKLNKHNSKFGEVLYISVADIMKLDDTAKSFLERTAPTFNGEKEMYNKEVEIINKIHHAKNKIAGAERD